VNVRPPRIAGDRKLPASLAVILVFACGTLSSVKAQDVLVGNADLLPQKATGVQDRVRPEYDPLGIKVGAFQLDPALTIGETYDDNIYATDRNLVGDSLTTTTGTLRAQSLGAGAAISGSGSFTSNRYLHNSVEDYLDFSTLANVGYLFGYSTTLNGSGQYTRTHLSRQDPSFPEDALTPPGLDTSGGSFDIRHTLVHGNLDLNVQLLSLNYHDAELPHDVFLSQDFRDNTELTFDLRDNFLVGQTVSAFLRVIHKEYDYKHDAQSGTLNRDTVADTAGGGAAFQITNLMNGEIGVGVLRLRNHDAVNSNTTTVSIRSNIEFYLTQLLTATAAVERGEGPAYITGSASFISTSATATLDYEFRRNVILTATFSRDYRNYTGINASETTLQGSAKARWLINRSLKLDFSYTLASRRSPLQTYLGENFNDRAVDLELELAL
jgi:hypothetical protein